MKLSSILILFAAICTSQTALGKSDPTVGISNMQKTLYDHDKELISWYTEGIRGFWYGVFRGFFHETRKPAPQCLNQNVDNQLTDILQFLAYGELADIFHVADSVTSLYYDNKNYCGEFLILATIKAKCSSRTEGDCKFVTLLKNLFVKNMVVGLGAMSVLADQIGKFRLQVDSDIIHEEMLNIGKNLGSIVAYTLDI